MNRPPGIGDFIASFKGDTPGHPFRGNQFEGGSGGSESQISEGFTRDNYMDVNNRVMKKAKDQLYENLPNDFEIAQDGRAVWKKENNGRRNAVYIGAVTDSDMSNVYGKFQISSTAERIDPQSKRYVSVKGPSTPKVFDTLNQAKEEAQKRVDIAEDMLK